MSNAEIKDKDTQAAVDAFNKRPRGWRSNKIAQAIANARAEGRQAALEQARAVGRRVAANISDEIEALKEQK